MLRLELKRDFAARGAVTNVSRRSAVICAKKPLSLLLRTHSFLPSFLRLCYLQCHPFHALLAAIAAAPLPSYFLPSRFFPELRGMGHWRFSPLKSVMVRKRTVWTAEYILRVVFPCKTVSIPNLISTFLSRAERSSVKLHLKGIIRQIHCISATDFH